MKNKFKTIDEIHKLLYECDLDTLEAIYSAIWNLIERSKANERKNHRFNRKAG